MKAFMDRYGAQVKRTISGWDRMAFRGAIQRLGPGGFSRSDPAAGQRGRIVEFPVEQQRAAEGLLALGAGLDGSGAPPARRDGMGQRHHVPRHGAELDRLFPMLARHGLIVSDSVTRYLGRIAAGVGELASAERRGLSARASRLLFIPRAPAPRACSSSRERTDSSPPPPRTQGRPNLIPRAHGLIRKVPKTHRRLVTPKGRRVKAVEWRHRWWRPRPLMPRRTYAKGRLKVTAAFGDLGPW